MAYGRRSTFSPDMAYTNNQAPDFFQQPTATGRAPAFQPDATYGNRLRQLVTDPNSFQGTPGFQFALNTGLDALDRSNSTIRNTPNALLAAMKYGTGLAQQDYGNEVSRLGTLSGQQQNYDLGVGQNANAATRNANDLLLGEQGNANTRYGIDANTGLGYTRAANDFSLGQGQNANAAQRNQFDYSLGQQSNANNAQRNQFDYSLGQGRNANDAAQIFGNYDLGQGRNAIDWYNAGTNRGTAEGNQYLGNQASQRAWYSVYPRQRVAGGP